MVSVILKCGINGIFSCGVNRFSLASILFGQVDPITIGVLESIL